MDPRAGTMFLWGLVPPYVLTIMAAGAFVAISLRRGGWRKWTALMILVGSMCLLPALFYANGAMDTIELYQARYIFPLLAPTLLPHAGRRSG